MIIINLNKLVFKTHLKIQFRKMSDGHNGPSIDNIDVEVQPENVVDSFKTAEGMHDDVVFTQEEHEFAVLLNTLAPGILPLKHSVLLKPVPDEIFEQLFAKNVKFSDKVNLLKPYLGQPNRPSLVKEMPTSSTPVVKHSPEKKEGIELLYIMRCISAIFPESADDLLSLGREAFSGDERTFDRVAINNAIEYLRKLRGASAPVSAVCAAALKLFYTVDGMAFDDFSVTLTALEWEQITQNMNELRIKHAARIREMSTEMYNLRTSKEVKLNDKRELDDAIYKDRIDLVRIMKFTLEDFHSSTQRAITSKLDFKNTLKQVRYDRKALIASVKSSILRAYRENPNMDVAKYAKRTIIRF